MDVLPIAAGATVDEYASRAAGLVSAADAGPDRVRGWEQSWLDHVLASEPGDPTPFVRDSFARVIRWVGDQVYERFGGNPELDLRAAKNLIASAHAFTSWDEFTAHVAERANQDPFERAADAIVHGDAVALANLLAKQPALTRARSARRHKATLLHYIAANGVEDFRQLTPPNALDIARILLDAGAEVDALAETYGGGRAQTTMNLLVSSTHPAEAGLQAALAELLLDAGAAINGLDDDSSPLMTALAFGYRDSAEALARRGARIDTPVAAAALGRLDLVRQWISARDSISSSVPKYTAYWIHVAEDPVKHVEQALIWACKFDRTDVAEYLIGLGVNVKAMDDMTPLHWAAANGNPVLLQRLLERGADLEQQNTWGGTVLDSTMYFARHAPVRGVDYPRVARALLDAGADARAVSPFPTGMPAIDAIIGPRRHSAT